jgi:hypothetical protein
MKVTVKPVNSLGKPLPVDERVSLPGFSGKFEIIGDDRSPHDPSMPVARVQERGCSRFLYEISILWFADDSMGLRGVEVIDGAQYAQTWDIKIELRSLTSGEPTTRLRRLKGRNGLPRLDAEALLSFVPEVKTDLRLVRRPPTK